MAGQNGGSTMTKSVDVARIERSTVARLERSESRDVSVPDVAAAPTTLRLLAKSRRKQSLLRGTSSLALATASVIVALGVSLPNKARAAGFACGPRDPNTGYVVCSGTLGGVVPVGGYTLKATNNPFDLDSQTSITAVTDAIHGDITGAVWTIKNEGSLFSSQSGIYLKQLGTITNDGHIESLNSDIIPITDAGIVLLEGGNITNNANGVIAGYISGVLIKDGTVVNRGSIRTTSDYIDVFAAIQFSSAAGIGNTVDNQLGGVITGGQYGVFNATTIFNRGLISATYPGDTNVRNIAALVNDDGFVRNSGGTFKGEIAVDIRSGGTVDNVSGLMQGTYSDAIVLQAGGSFTNGQGGVVEGKINGVHVESAAGTVFTAGSITGTNGDAINMEAGGSVDVSGGSVEGGVNGIRIARAAGKVTQGAGSIKGTTGDGIDIETDGLVDQTGGSVTGGMDGIFVGGLALQLLYRKVSESMGNHDSEIVDAGSVD